LKTKEGVNVMRLATILDSDQTTTHTCQVKVSQGLDVTTQHHFLKAFLLQIASAEFTS
jgi:hypothetical protein